MMIVLDAAGSDNETQSDEVPPPTKKATGSKRPIATTQAGAKKKCVEAVASESEELHDDGCEEDESAPAPTKKTNRAAVLR